MKRVIGILGCLMAIAAFQTASALTIDATSADFGVTWPVAYLTTNPDGANRWEVFNHPANPSIEEVQKWTATSTIEELFKMNVGASSPEPDFPLSNSYTVKYIPNVGPSDFEIEYKGGLYLGGSEPKFLMVKDGNAVPTIYIFDITTWDGTETISGKNFWLENGAISHVSLFGVETTQPTSVPDGGATAAMLGLSILGLGLVIRRKS